MSSTVELARVLLRLNALPGEDAEVAALGVGLAQAVLREADDHSASRRVDVLEREAPHLIARDEPGGVK